MGSDLAVCFVDRAITIADIARLKSLSRSEARVIYVVTGKGRDLSANRDFFAIWSSEPVDILGSCQELSVRSTVCIAWKSEHGGVGGYVRFGESAELENVSDSGDEYLLLPSRGVEVTFGTPLPLSDEERLCYPEILLDADAECFEIAAGRREPKRCPEGTFIKLLEEDLDVDPALPLEG